ncbi:MAG: YfhO family protein [Lachnospiraceae bacterium]|nr:YfhO family protein [Lachnospiraceae bacterium]
MKKYNTTCFLTDEKNTKKIGYALAFALPLVFCLIMMFLGEIYPFGENCILHVDMYHQYEPFFTEFASKLKSGSSLLFSWKLGMGSDFVSLIAYYLASPFNLILLFWPINHVIEAMTVIIVAKLCLMSVTFFAYENYHFKKCDLSYVLFGLFYTFSGYIAAYYWDIMWLDALMLLPIVLIGLERLVWEDKPFLYAILLGITIFSNYYIAYMVCIFQVIWFLFQFINIDEKIRKVIVSVRFVFFSLIGASFGAILIIPEAYILRYSGNETESFPSSVKVYFSILEEITRMSFSVEPYTSGDHWPNLYCGVACLVLLVLYFANNNIKLRDKIIRAVVLIYFLLSFSINIPDYIWHGMHFPNSLPARQSFLFIFLILVMGQEAYLRMKENRPRHFLYALGVGVLFIVNAVVFGQNAGIDKKTIVLTSVILGGYIMLLFFLDTCKKNERKVFMGLLCAMALVECFANFNSTGLYTTSRTSYTSNWEAISSLVESANSSDSTFWRMEKEERKTKNDAMIHGYRSETIFSSLMNINIGTLFKAVGMEAGKNFYSNSGATALTDAMFSMKYLISDCDSLTSPLRTLIDEADGYYLYENNYVLPVGYTIPSNLEENWIIESKASVKNINNLAYTLGASFDLLQETTNDAAANLNSTVYSVKEEGYYYASYDDKSVKTISITTSAGTRQYTKADHVFLLDFGYLEEGETVTLQFEGVDTLPINVYKMNLAVMEEVFNNLNTNVLENIEYGDTYLSGTIHIEEGEDLLLTVPYEDGWTLYVNGEEYNKDSLMEAFTLVKLSPGDYEIEMKYFTPGLVTGAIITLCGILILVALVLVGYFGKKKVEIALKEMGQN